MKKMYEEGGLATDGLEIDPVSGNDIPVGSNAVDVRDDIDAKLSEGEYVVPADVVKYIGVSTLEKMVNKAKEGLGGMEAEGRIGGASPEAKEEILEYSLGSDIQSLDGYATGGLVEGTDYNAIIDRVKDAAMKDPSITNMLKAKGIFVDTSTQGSPVKMAEGGVVEDPLSDNYSPSNFGSDFNPYAHTPGFSAQSGAPIAGGYTPPAAPVVEQPAVTCPPGYVFDAATNACVVDPAARPARSGSSDRAPQQPQADPNAWMDKYDYTNPETLVEQTMGNLGVSSGDAAEEEEGGFFDNLGGKIMGTLAGGLAGGILGRFTNSTTYAEAMANAAVLESNGHTAQAAAIREAAGTFAEANDINVGGFFDSSERLTNSAMGIYGRNTMVQDTPTAASTRPASTPTATTPLVTRPVARPTDPEKPASNNTRSSKTAPSQGRSEGSSTAAARRSAERNSAARSSSATARSNKAISDSQGNSAAQNQARAQAKAPSTARTKNTGSGLGGVATRNDSVSARDRSDPRNMNKGGLVARPTKKSKKKK